MDALARFNKARWEELSSAGISYTKPWLDLSVETARSHVDPEHVLGDVQGRRVLCLAAGGGQQSAAFGLLGAQVTVLDISERQIKTDLQVAAHYGFKIKAVQGDMRDLSSLPQGSFDVVWQAHSLNFVPEVSEVFHQVGLVIRKDGRYRLHFANPFVFGLWLEKWSGRGYPLHREYRDGSFLRCDPHWYFDTGKGKRQKVAAPKEFVHTLSKVINSLISNSFRLCGIWEDHTGNITAKPGSWEHFKAIAPPWLTVVCERASRP
jgi:SAM-dependent methyltransferase